MVQDPHEEGNAFLGHFPGLALFHQRKSQHQAGNVRKESGIPMPIIRVTREGLRSWSTAMIPAVIMGAMAD